MESISRALLTFLVNSLWQVPLVAGAAAGLCRLLRNSPARHRHAVWVAAMAAAILLPLSSMRIAKQEPVPQYRADLTTEQIAVAKTRLKIPANESLPLPPPRPSLDLS